MSLWHAVVAQAQSTGGSLPPAGPNFWESFALHAVATVLYTLIGLTTFALMFWIIARVLPFSIRKEIEEDQNVALGIVLGALVLGVALIIAAAVHG